MSFLRLSTLLVAVGLFMGCGNPPASTGPISMTWTNLSGELEMPTGIDVFMGEDSHAPLTAWMARVDTDMPGIDVRVVSSSDTDGRESVSDMVQDNNACLGVNGGYFFQTQDSFAHIGLLIANGAFVQSAVPGIIVEETRYPVRRSALGFDDANNARMGWVSSRNDSSFWWEKPVSNQPGTPYSAEDSVSGSFWNAQDAVSAGPMIIRDAKTMVASAEEVFFHTAIPDIHPRTAAGIDSEGRLLLMVVDGRQQSSRGVSLEELSDLMLDFGAVEAMNLDGGGSSTFIVRDDLLNRPAGATYQREVVSGIIVSCS